MERPYTAAVGLGPRDFVPRSTIMKSTMGFCLLLSVKIHEQVWGFVDADPVQRGGWELWFQALPDCDRDVFCRRNLGEEFWYLFVQKAVIHGVEDFAMHDFFELLEVDDESGARVDFALDRDF